METTEVTTTANTTGSLNPEMCRLISAFSNFIYYVTTEEDRFLRDIEQRYVKDAARGPMTDVKVFYPTLGLTPFAGVMSSWRDRTMDPHNPATVDIHQALQTIYRDTPADNKVALYIILDPERFLNDSYVVRRLVNLSHQMSADLSRTKIVIFVGHKAVVPEKMQRLIEVVTDQGLPPDVLAQQLDQHITDLRADLEQYQAPCSVGERTPEMTEAFKGLTAYEVRSAFAQSIDPTTGSVNLSWVQHYKRSQLNKTSLVTYLDSAMTFAQVGGVPLFKEWARKTKAAWSPEGQAFGLKPPKGVLLVGAWGCGKSISVKALASEWGLPMLQLSMGKIRSSLVGETEHNMQQVLALAEAVSPCILWLDEAEKEMAGGASSSSSDAGTTSRVIGIFSTWMQETKAQVCLAMTANGVKTLPPELLNRADERFFFNVPDPDERIEILKIHLKASGQDPSQYDLARLGDASDTMVGREIEQAINSALMDSFHEGCPCLDEGILAKSLKSKPRIYKTMQDDMQEILGWVGYDAELDDGIRARYASPKGHKPTLKMIKG